MRRSPGSGPGTRRRWAGCSARCCGCWPRRAWCRWALLSLDGTKLAGNAAQKANRTLPQIEKLLAEAAATDAADDARDGERRRGDAAGAGPPGRAAGAAGRGPGPAGGRGRGPPSGAAGQAGSLGRRRSGRRPRAAQRPADEPRTNRNNTEPRANITDPDVRVMRNQKGYVAGYNGQLVVTAQQVIVGAMLSRHPVDRTLLHPLLDTCRQQLAAGRDPPEAAHRARRLRLCQRGELRPRRC